MDTGANALDVLHDLAMRMGTRVTKKKVGLMGGSVLTRQLRALYRGHKLGVLANENLILLDIEASYGHFHLLKINPRLVRVPYGKPACAIRIGTAKHVVFTGDGSLSQWQSELYELGVLARLLAVINPQEGEEINISQRLVRVYMQGPSADRVMAVVRAVINLMPHESDWQTRAEFDSLPDALRPLVPLITKWAVSDDEERSRKIRRCAQSTRQKLVDAVVPLLPAINQFLDAFGNEPSEEACALGALAEAALEAQSILTQQ